MSYRECFFLVEGYTDEIFFRKLICPLLEGEYDYTEVRSFRGSTPADLHGLFHSWHRRGDVYVVADRSPSPCISEAKRRVKREFGNAPIEKFTIITVPEIEAWYVAGITEDFAQRYGMVVPQAVEQVDKQQFEELSRKAHFSSKIDLMQEITKHYDMELAKQRSASFLYLARRIGI